MERSLRLGREDITWKAPLEEAASGAVGKEEALPRERPLLVPQRLGGSMRGQHGQGILLLCSQKGETVALKR